MGRPIGSANRQKPFNDALTIALRGDPLRLRRIADKLAALAEGGDLAAIREVADRLDGKPAAEKTHIDSGGQIRVIVRQIDVCPEEPLLLAKK
jgi:hypothetical protein